MHELCNRGFSPEALLQKRLGHQGERGAGSEIDDWGYG